LVLPYLRLLILKYGVKDLRLELRFLVLFL